MRLPIAITALLLAAVPVHGQTLFSTASCADAFLAGGSAGNPMGADVSGLNFGGAGTLVVAPASSLKGEFRSVIQFDLAGAKTLFDSTYGEGGWSLSGITLSFASNYGTAGVQPNNPVFNVISGGLFEIRWFGADGWLEGTGTPTLPTTDGVTLSDFASLVSGDSASLGLFQYVPPGDNVRTEWSLPMASQLVADAEAGGKVSFALSAADNQISCLFNSLRYGRGNEPKIVVVAIPEPRTCALVLAASGAMLGVARRRSAI